MSIDDAVDGECAEGTERCANLPARDPKGHKGTFGTVLVIGGCVRLPRVMLGGPVIAARAALRTGCGLAELAVPEPLATAALAALHSATALALPVDDAGSLKPSECAELLDPVLDRVQSVIIGPALGEGFAVEQVVVRLLNHVRTPMIIDADGLNALARLPDFPRDIQDGGVILTPHPGEYRRLAQSLGLDDIDPTDPTRRGDAADALARRVGCVVVLKGDRTVVSDGIHRWSARAGNAALATGGSGDALAGVIGSLAAQFSGRSHHLSLFDCARLGVAIHGLAAQSWRRRAGDAGLLVDELCDEIPAVLAALREENSDR
ncbi:MAG: NAD(P)H-hydrate dehydratase [Phycisphaerales bacterium]|nr:NAD(P)H-hydrate dehydratase [Phycisphaerales bacterium]